MSVSLSVIECPICMDAIDVTKNNVVTDCGHMFHCSCLMQNAAHNGFGCPYCRTTMANEPLLKDEDDFTDIFSHGSQEILYRREDLSDNALTSFRMFIQQLDGEEPEEEPEQEYEEHNNIALDIPNAEYMATKLMERNITYEDLVKNILYNFYSDWDLRYNHYGHRSAVVFGQFRAITSRYERETGAINATSATLEMGATEWAF